MDEWRTGRAEGADLSCGNFGLEEAFFLRVAVLAGHVTGQDARRKDTVVLRRGRKRDRERVRGSWRNQGWGGRFCVE